MVLKYNLDISSDTIQKNPEEIQVGNGHSNTHILARYEEE